MENHRRKHPLLTAAKVIMLILTAIYPLFMVTLSGAGIIYNKDSYGEELATVGTLLIVSGFIMAAGAVLCIFRKNLLNIISAVCSAGGLALCLDMMYKLCDHADRAGWTDNFSMTPISDMYKVRITPSIAPVAIALAIAAVQLFSYEAAEERRRRRQRRNEEENAPAPSIIDE